MAVQPYVQTYFRNLLMIFTLAVMTSGTDLWAEPEARIQPTRGEYLGQSWHIDANHLLWWEGKPYVRYGFTGNGNVDSFMKKGFTQFNAYPSEELWVFSKDSVKNRQAVQEVDVFTDLLQEKGATYYAGLNLLWPWRGSGKIAHENMVNCVFRKVWDITEFSKKDEAIELEFTSDVALAVKQQKVQVYLFDFVRGRYRDISDKLQVIRIAEKTIEESASERYRCRKNH